jgi:predicted  nucleic acid-binding Zn-ribbon protein
VAVLAEAEELATAIEAENAQSVEAQHRELRRKGRQQQEVCNRLNQRLDEAEVALRNALLKKERAVDALKALKATEKEGQHVSRWADDRELAAWNSRIAAAQRRIQEADAEAAEAMTERNEIRLKTQAAQKELQKIGIEEVRLRKSKSGQPFTDPEYGLEVRE